MPAGKCAPHARLYRMSAVARIHMYGGLACCAAIVVACWRHCMSARMQQPFTTVQLRCTRA
eukprot:365526-Chlamydomonas_euryale.AAC.17